MERQFLHEVLYRGEEAVKKLNEASVTLAGCGAIGSWVGIMLARMGVSKFRLIDKDTVEIHNVSTQLFEPSNLGKSKVTVLQRKLYNLSKARAETQKVELTEGNAEALLLRSDIVVCSFDNRKGRIAVKKACLKRSIPCLFAGMEGLHMYLEVIWAENYSVPEDPQSTQIDPCNYPLATTLTVLTSAITSELTAQYLSKGEKKQCRMSFGEIIKS